MLFNQTSYELKSFLVRPLNYLNNLEENFYVYNKKFCFAYVLCIKSQFKKSCDFNSNHMHKNKNLNVH